MIRQGMLEKSLPDESEELFFSEAAKRLKQCSRITSKMNSYPKECLF
jgi:hypothetical protein